MKKAYITIILGLISFMTVCAQKAEFSSPASAKSSVPQFKWTTDTVMNLGKIEANKPVTVAFEFVNSGGAPLLISRVEPSCGCTGIDYSKAAIVPNKKGFVKATYDAASVGYFSKTITVFSNATDLRKVLTIKGEVIKN